MNIALIVFGGKGTRMNTLVPKQFVKIEGHELVAYTINVFEMHPLIHEIVLVTSDEYYAYTQNLVFRHHFKKVTHVVKGGETRQESVRNGLNETNYRPDDYILIHDGDRPMVNDKIITDCLRGLLETDAVTVAIKSKDALKEVSNLGRKYYYYGDEYDIQTPQAFKYSLIKEVHNRLKDMEFSDDASLVLEIGKDVKIIEGVPNNFKVTKDQDLDYLKKIIGEYHERY